MGVGMFIWEKGLIRERLFVKVCEEQVNNDENNIVKIMVPQLRQQK